MKIAIIGNSHTACVKKAWDEIVDRQGTELVFFASSGPSIVETIVKDGVLCPLNDRVKKSFVITSGGSDRIHISSYDLIVIHGIIPSILVFSELLKSIDGGIYSYSFREKCFGNIDGVFGDFFQNLLNIKGNVILTPRPAPSYKNELMAIGDLSEKDFNRALNYVLEGCKNIGVKYIAQAPETMFGHSFTKRDYVRDGIGLGWTPRIKNDWILNNHENFTHMNVQYGRVYLKQIFSCVGISSIVF